MTDIDLPRIMGVVNVTPDSFSDGGRYHDVAAAAAHARALHAAGADIIDVGGESTRPGAARVDADIEQSRVVPVVAALAAEGITVSVDTTRAAVAEAACDNGATIVNDVSAGQADPQMPRLLARNGCRIVLMHRRGESSDMYRHAHYEDVVAEVGAELSAQVTYMREAGVTNEQIIVDPGLGFAKHAEHNWELIARLHELTELRYPLLFGASRKGFLGKALADADGEPRPATERDIATAATSMLAFDAGAWGVRVHDVAATADMRAVWAATRHARRAYEARGAAVL